MLKKNGFKDGQIVWAVHQPSVTKNYQLRSVELKLFRFKVKTFSNSANNGELYHSHETLGYFDFSKSLKHYTEKKQSVRGRPKVYDGSFINALSDWSGSPEYVLFDDAKDAYNWKIEAVKLAAQEIESVLLDKINLVKEKQLKNSKASEFKDIENVIIPYLL